MPNFLVASTCAEGRKYPSWGRPLDMAESAIDDFAAGIARSSMSLAVVGLVGLVLSALWPVIASTTILARNKVLRRKSDESQMPDHP